jgi:chromate transport protein ChrA
MIIKKEFKIARDVFNLYGKIGLLQMVDSIVDVVLPVILLLVGYCVIVQDNAFIKAVLNTADLLFTRFSTYGYTARQVQGRTVLVLYNLLYVRTIFRCNVQVKSQKNESM